MRAKPLAPGEFRSAEDVEKHYEHQSNEQRDLRARTKGPPMSPSGKWCPIAITKINDDDPLPVQRNAEVVRASLVYRTWRCLRVTSMAAFVRRKLE